MKLTTKLLKKLIREELEGLTGNIFKSIDIEFDKEDESFTIRVTLKNGIQENTTRYKYDAIEDKENSEALNNYTNFYEEFLEFELDLPEAEKMNEIDQEIVARASKRYFDQLDKLDLYDAEPRDDEW